MWVCVCVGNFTPSDFRISGHPFINKSCHNSRTSHDIDMKLGQLTKLDKTNTTTLRRIDDKVMSTNCDVIIFFQIYGQFTAIQKPNSGQMVYEVYIFIKSNLLSYKSWKQNWKLSNRALMLLIWVKALFFLENADFLLKKSWHQQN